MSLMRMSYPQAKNFTIKEVPIPEVKDDEILLKGTILSIPPRGSKISVFTWLCGGIVTYCGVCGVCIHDPISVLGKLNSDGRPCELSTD